MFQASFLSGATHLKAIHDWNKPKATGFRSWIAPQPTATKRKRPFRRSLRPLDVPLDPPKACERSADGVP
jgi:hypothetical protein